MEGQRPAPVGLGWGQPEAVLQGEARGQQRAVGGERRERWVRGLAEGMRGVLALPGAGTALRGPGWRQSW